MPFRAMYIHADAWKLGKGKIVDGYALATNIEVMAKGLEDKGYEIVAVTPIIGGVTAGDSDLLGTAAWSVTQGVIILAKK